MYRFLTVLTIVWMAVLALMPKARAGVDVGLSVDEDGIKGFYLAIGEHYRVPEREVIVVRDRNVPDEELPVVFFLARHASVEPAMIVRLRLGGMSWMDIALHFSLSPSIFYIDFDRDPGPPYGKAWGHYRKHDKAHWGEIRLPDADIVNIVNLKFVSEKYGYSPAEVVKMRARGDRFVAIHKQAKAGKGKPAKGKQVVADSNDDNQKSHGKKHK
ncbi:MAG: hypothetical protein NTW07_08015 [candidate division Zixibacteria bacterium]|nr:hypothetical protein [candidate division Zixibacteria bacterium]